MEKSREEIMKQQPLYAEVRKRPPRVDDTKEYVNTTQRCLRYKQRRARPILRSKSDISDRRTDGRSPNSAPCEGDDSPDSPSEDSCRLRQFFERLGLQERQYEALLSAPPDSPVFFSSASTLCKLRV
ncbi:Uncharacterized protein OBRU01_07431 [Operophtera brumata]|uniref:Uncharacterized protein n=1 Tax=Operophtera brumata TaxID=104452 RepID=A0A0L7LJ46_OPEBR|nr:Uncharacterized protein OBRU01_07431 [Operophtera brumata]